MLEKPVLAHCSNRSRIAQQNARAGGPEDWFTGTLLSQRGYDGISFDFFVNWRSSTLAQEIWIKRIVSSSYQPWPEHDTAVLQHAIENCDGATVLKEFAQFTVRNGLTLRYHLFKESVEWRRYPSPIVTASISSTGTISTVQDISLHELMRQIQHLSGGPVNVGSKGLIYGTTTLECYLSHTDAAWPGDVDLIITDGVGNALIILEFKKHNLDDPIENQILANYYPHRDARKYDRLAILRDSLDPDLPIIIVYYPTKPHIHHIKLELIKGRPYALKSMGEQLIALPAKDDTPAHMQILEAIMNMVNA